MVSTEQEAERPSVYGVQSGWVRTARAWPRQPTGSPHFLHHDRCTARQHRPLGLEKALGARLASWKGRHAGTWSPDMWCPCWDTLGRGKKTSAVLVPAPRPQF